MRNKLFAFACIMFFTSALSAQDMTINGAITSAEDGLPVIGATIVRQGVPSSGTITDQDGNYSIRAAPSDTLVISYVGLATTRIPVEGRTRIDVVLEPDKILIDEVVVTALGMEREKKALGYAVQEVTGEELKQTKELNVLNALSGKAAGVNITQGGGGLDGGGARIVIRGETSLAGNNTPLFVIDGIPGGANDVAADDIASISILKGPAAAALYGSRAAAGVVLITTKTGEDRKGQGIGIEVNSTTSFQTPFILPDYQNQFGQGTGSIYKYYDGNNGVWPDGSISNDDYSINWGPEFDGELRPQFTGNDPWVAYPNNVRDFYLTGNILNNNIALSGANEGGHYRASYSNIRQKGIIPNTGIQSHSVDLSGGWNLTEKLSIFTNFKYRYKKSDNTRTEDVRSYPRNIDIKALKDYWVPGLEGLQQLKWRSSSNNPYFELYENRNAYVQNRVIGNATLNYQFTDYLSFMGRIGLSENHHDANSRTAFSTVGANNQFGSFSTSQTRSYEMNSDFLLTFDKDLTPHFNLKASVGGNAMRTNYSKVAGNVEQLLVPDIYNLGNHRIYPKNSNWVSQKQLNSLYGFANLAYRKMIYLDITARNDWSSALPVDKNSYFYPSFALSSLMSTMFDLPDQISFWKIRGSWARVGNDTDPYQLQDAYFWGTGEGGRATISQSNIKANPDLKPELTSAWEGGTDIRFFNNRLQLDVTYYNSVTSNQILRVEVSPTTGYEFILKNAGMIRNKGWEIMLRGNIISHEHFFWTAYLNWSRDRAIVEEYDPENPEAFLSRSVTTHLFVEDKLGERRGALYGKGFERAPNGEILFTKSGDTQRGAKKYLGNYNPDWIGSLQNQIGYKKISLAFLLDLRFGGKFYSRTNYDLNIRGLSEATLLGGPDPNGVYTPREYILPDGMILDDGEYRELTREDLIESGLSSGGLTGQQYWENIMDAEIPEAVIYDATYLKFRELVVSYTLPSNLINNTSFEAASLSVVIRNLAVWTRIPNVDPETFSGSQQAGAVLGYDSGGVPSVRNIALNVNLRF
ncbi:MAG: SusC/RagA family TonB-linked outer membrane protein [Bacteroidales bacterium]|nr:SusC/RagA family TonB-linked outer membrane protein [Bacteroidales bacterium]